MCLRVDLELRGRHIHRVLQARSKMGGLPVPIRHAFVDLPRKRNQHLRLERESAVVHRHLRAVPRHVRRHRRRRLHHLQPVDHQTGAALCPRARARTEDFAQLEATNTGRRAGPSTSSHSSEEAPIQARSPHSTAWPATLMAGTAPEARFHHIFG